MLQPSQRTAHNILREWGEPDYISRAYKSTRTRLIMDGPTTSNRLLQFSERMVSEGRCGPESTAIPMVSRNLISYLANINRET